MRKWLMVWANFGTHECSILLDALCDTFDFMISSENSGVFVKSYPHRPSGKIECLPLFGWFIVFTFLCPTED